MRSCKRGTGGEGGGLCRKGVTADSSWLRIPAQERSCAAPGEEEEGREEENPPRLAFEHSEGLRSFDKTAPGVAFLEPGQVPEHLNPTHARLTGGRCIGSMTGLLNL